MKIINGVEQDGRVESLVDLEELVEMTPDGFRPMHLGTLEEIVARLKARTDQRTGVSGEHATT